MRIEQNISRPESHGKHSLSGRLYMAVGAIKRRWAGQEALRQLNEMADWELDDIGLSREDFHRLRDLSPLDDPVRALAQMVRDREREAGRRKP
jgi:uncharacterized protein YjiS (DUF1127 family)